MKIICVEEHVTDTDIQSAATPVVMKEAPYFATLGSLPAQPRNPHRPTNPGMTEALQQATDYGEGRLKDMDDEGIQMQVLSNTAPIQLVEGSDAVAMARAANDRLAQAKTEYPDRFGGFAMLPWQDPKAAEDELSRAVNELGLQGVLIMGRPSAGFLDDPIYRPILKKFQELNVPIYIHPFYPAPQVADIYYDGLDPLISGVFALGGWGWHHEAGIHVLRLMLGGVFEELPELQVISGHWGEMVPFYLARLDYTMPQTVTGHSMTFTERYRNNVWVTPAGMFDLPHFEFIAKEIGVDRIIWSTDYPYVRMDGAREFLMSLPVSEEDRAKMAHGNAERLFRF